MEWKKECAWCKKAISAPDEAVIAAYAFYPKAEAAFWHAECYTSTTKSFRNDAKPLFWGLFAASPIGALSAKNRVDDAQKKIEKMENVQAFIADGLLKYQLGLGVVLGIFPAMMVLGGGIWKMSLPEAAAAGALALISLACFVSIAMFVSEVGKHRKFTAEWLDGKKQQ